MNMQDKEFDDLFRSKLDNFEAEPSTQVWQNVDAGLSGRKRGSILPILSIAASVLILLVAGILFIPKKGGVKHNRPDSNQVAVNKANQAVVRPESVNPVTTPGKKEELVARAQMPVARITSTHQSKVIVMPAKRKEREQQFMAEKELVKPEQQQILAAGDNIAEQNTKPIELEVAPSVAKHTEYDATISIPDQPVLASTAVPTEKTAKPVARKHGIRNFGDLVNLVVAKVDKRKDKLIQFTDSDDDESIISGVHLGALKIKKDN
jgi:hypothetical protein